MELNLNEVLRESFNYLDEEKRLATYESWIFSDNENCNVRKMAEAGFIFIGNEEEPDAVKCFFCDKHLDGWESADDPWKEHIKHSSNCSFVKFQKPENITLHDILTLRHELFANTVRSYLQNITSSLTKSLKQIESKLKK